MGWWIAGFVCIGIPLALIAFAVIWYIRFAQREAAKDAKLEREGQVVKGWIVFANDNLYKVNHPDNVWRAQVVFTLEEVPDLDATLESLAEAIRDFETENEKDDDERIIGQVVRTHYGYRWPLRIPKRITGRLEAYTVSLDVACRDLPERKLTLPFLYCKAYIGDGSEDRAAKHIPYPEAEPSAAADPAS